MTTEEPKINISEIVSSLINDGASTSNNQEAITPPKTPEPKSPASETTSTESIPTVSSPTPTIAGDSRKEHAKLYQREYRKRQKIEKELLRETQIKGSEILMVFTNGQIVSRDLHTEDDYIEMLNDFSESLKKQGSLLSFRITQRLI